MVPYVTSNKGEADSMPEGESSWVYVGPLRYLTVICNGRAVGGRTISHETDPHAAAMEMLRDRGFDNHSLKRTRQVGLELVHTYQ